MARPGHAADGAVSRQAENATLPAAPAPSSRHLVPREAALQPAAAAGADYPTWGLVETLDIMADDDLMDEIARSEEDVRAGRVVRWDDLLGDLGSDLKKEDTRTGRVVR